LKNMDKYNQNQPGDRRPGQDPIIQSVDESGNHNKAIQPAKAVVSAVQPAILSDGAFVFNQMSATQGTVAPAQSISDIIQSILRFKWTIILLFILVAVPLTAVIWTQITPKYRARAEVRVKPIIPYLVYKTEDNGMIPLYNSFMNTQVSIIRSLTVLQRVLDKRDIQNTQWFRAPQKTLLSRLLRNKDSAIERLRDDLSVSPRSNTEIIDVSFLTTRPSDAKLIVDAVLEQYIKYTGETSNASENEIYNQLVAQYNSLDRDIQSREKVIAELSKKIGTGTPQELVSSKQLQLDHVKVQLKELQQKMALIEWGIRRINGIGDANDSSDVIADANNRQPKYSEDDEWRKRELDVKTIQHRIDSSSYTSKHPEIIQAQKDLEFAKELLTERQKQLDEQWLYKSLNISGASTAGTGASPASLSYLLNEAKYQEGLLNKELQKQQTEFDVLFESAQSLQRETDELKRKRDTFEAVRLRKEQKDMERNVPGTIEILMGALVSSRPDNDRRVVFTIMVIAMGLGFGGVVAFMRATKNQVVYTPQDVPRPLQMPLLGYMPLVDLKKSLGKALSGEIKQKQFLLNESVRVMRTALLSRLDSQDSTVILITSSIKGTGKSSFTNTLGRSMAQAGKAVLIIDADFHKMSLSESYDMLNKPGFMNYLSKESVEIPFIYPTDTPGLSIMPAGERKEGRVAFEELANGSFQNCMNQLRKRYQIILLDSPPMQPVADATILSRQVDGAILVERERVSHRGDIVNAISRLNSAGGRLFGFAFVGSMDFQKYGYDSYYTAKE
jgi:polysaccharide biosynthesis transport protein